jgi:hypothetical protein
VKEAVFVRRVPTILPPFSDLRRYDIKTLELFVMITVYITLIYNELLRPPNTDNKGKLFVTVFAYAPVPKTNS